jgi:hypothetical protein
VQPQGDGNPTPILIESTLNPFDPLNSQEEPLIQLMIWINRPPPQLWKKSIQVLFPSIRKQSRRLFLPLLRRYDKKETSRNVRLIRRRYFRKTIEKRRKEIPQRSKRGRSRET